MKLSFEADHSAENLGKSLGIGEEQFSLLVDKYFTFAPKGVEITISEKLVAASEAAETPAELAYLCFAIGRSE